MNRPVLPLAILGLALGALAAVVGLPYGRVDPRAFAELYHGPTDTTGMFHMAIDCDTSTPATDTSCLVPLPQFAGATTASVDITIGNSTGTDVLVAAFTSRSGIRIRRDWTR